MLTKGERQGHWPAKLAAAILRGWFGNAAPQLRRDPNRRLWAEHVDPAGDWSCMPCGCYSVREQIRLG